MKKNLKKIEARALVEALVESEKAYLSGPETDPGTVKLGQSGLPHFSPFWLLAREGRTVKGISDRDVQRYQVPPKAELRLRVRRWRDGLLQSHRREGPARLRNEKGHFCPISPFEIEIKALNRVLRMV